jgi:hypothetical protein
VSKVKNEIKKDKEPFIKTKVKPNHSIEVEMKSPIKTTAGKVFIIILVLLMTVLGLAGLIYLMITVGGSL